MVLLHSEHAEENFGPGADECENNLVVSPSAHRSLCTAKLKGKQNIILSGWRLLRLISAIICNCRAEGTILPKDNVAQSPSEERTLKRKDQTHDEDTLSAILKISI